MNFEVGVGKEGIPQGLQSPFFFVVAERPKAEALGYLEAKTTAKADSSAALRNDKQKGQATAKAKATHPFR